jgi:ABC-type antimicrobial peptide transport system permease subunit
VVGIVAAESEFPSGASPHYNLYATTAYAAAFNNRVALLQTYYVRLAHGDAGLAGFDSRFRSPDVYGTSDLDEAADAVFGAATLLHLLLVSVASRRVEAGLLKALGFVRRQVAATVCWQATAVALVGIAVGAPAGIAAGKVLWRVFATNFGVVPVAVTEPVLIAALAAGVLAGANLLAAVPALLAARSQPARLLRAE